MLEYYINTDATQEATQPTEQAAAVNKCRQESICFLSNKQKNWFDKAIAKGWMQETETGYKWLFGGNRGKVRLAYFLKKVYNPDGCEITPFKKLEALFNEERLDVPTTQLLNAKKEPKWQREIDNLFE